MKKLLFLVGALLVLGGCTYEPQEPNVGATLPVAGVTYTLAGTGITASATSITLQTLTIPQTGYELQDSDFSDIFYITLEPGNTKRQEIAACTTVTQNANNTATLSGCSRGMTPFTPFTASTTYAFSHGGGTSVIFSDPPQLFNEFTAKSNSETITRVWTFDVHPIASSSLSTPTSTYQYVTKQYADNIVNQGAATSTESNAGISELATQIEMASTTDLGVDRPLVLQAKYATSTCQVAGLYIPVTQNDGKISNVCLDLTETYNFSSTSTVTFGGVTMNASSTANALIISQPNGKLERNWLPLQVVTHLINATTTDGEAPASSVATTTLFGTSTIPGGAMGTSGTLHVHFEIDDFDLNNPGSNNNTATTTLVINGINVLSVTMTNNLSGALVNLNGTVDVYIINNGTGSQEASMTVRLSNRLSNLFASSSEYMFTQNTTLSTDTTQNWTMYITGKHGGSVANRILSGRGYAHIINTKDN